MDGIDGRIVRVRGGQRELGANMPSLLHVLGDYGFQIGRDDTRRGRNVGISKQEEK